MGRCFGKEGINLLALFENNLLTRDIVKLLSRAILYSSKQFDNLTINSYYAKIQDSHLWRTFKKRQR